MADHEHQRFSQPQARAQARAWLARQHSDAHELAVTLLHYVPEPTAPEPSVTCRPASYAGWPGCWPRAPTCARSPRPSSPTSSATPTQKPDGS